MVYIVKDVNGYDPKINTRRKFDFQKAKNLMTEAGYPNGFNLAMVKIFTIVKAFQATSMTGQKGWRK
ncbi:MAG: hypothetical protein Q8L85_00300 [Alphaproteobacteria bacterium]|nr:hypothetical protein [Alphaproteobacteria bacterium]